jgi:hypothetical protein
MINVNRYAGHEVESYGYEKVNPVMNHRFKSYMKWLPTTISLMLICICMYRASSALIHNIRLQQAFATAQPPSSYLQGIPMSEMDLSLYSSYMPRIMAPLLHELTRDIKTPVTLRYYSKIPAAGDHPALEIPKGTNIIVLPADRSGSGSPLYEPGYGYTSYPTYEQGWRYVRPFQLSDSEQFPHDDHYYFVRMEDLEAVIGELVQANRALRVAIQQQGWSIQEGIRQISTCMDQLLYSHGAYLSPDLYSKVMDRWNFLMAGAVLLNICLWGGRSWLTRSRAPFMDRSRKAR